MVLTERKEYHENGQLKWHWFEDEAGRCQGIFLNYYGDGTVYFKSYNLDHMFHGERIWYRYNENGTIIRHDVYINGKFYCEYYQLSEMDKFELSLKYGVIWF